MENYRNNKEFKFFLLFTNSHQEINPQRVNMSISTKVRNRIQVPISWAILATLLISQ